MQLSSHWFVEPLKHIHVPVPFLFISSHGTGEPLSHRATKSHTFFILKTLTVTDKPPSHWTTKHTPFLFLWMASHWAVEPLKHKPFPFLKLLLWLESCQAIDPPKHAPVSRWATENTYPSRSWNSDCNWWAAELLGHENVQLYTFFPLNSHY